ncbi:MAG: alkaline phytoceramidase [Gammaproteobacteria bacterium]|nr:alkaline phytoceramidase [Gammaproteobacteria bacterium]
MLAAIALVAMLFVPPIPQDPAYHAFADVHTMLGIPNALNILSNLLLLWVGVEGLLRLARNGSLCTLPAMTAAYGSFFAALILTAAGSSWYHLAPDNASLAWDRGAMTLGFMSFFCILLAERVSVRVATRLFPLLMIIGPATIVYWHYSELAGRGDLRAYALVQFLPLALAPLILLLFPSRYTRNRDLWMMLAFYLLAKLLEILDHETFALTGWIGGHALKHLVAGLACYAFLRHLRLRRALEA